jgi:ribonuclease T1
MNLMNLMNRIYRVLMMLWLSLFLGHAAAFSTELINSDTVPLSQLPKEAHKTLLLIQSGGPFPYPDKDGSVFSNRERTLSKQRRGYYTEYTVKTPYARNRGARRIIAGQGNTGNPATSGEYFYTDDHYATFKRIELTK